MGRKLKKNPVDFIYYLLPLQANEHYSFVMEYLHEDQTFGRFFQPLQQIYKQSDSLRKCDKNDDWNHLSNGVLRVVNEYHSGRAFLQDLIQNFGSGISVQSYFSSLKSERRKNVMEDCVDMMINSSQIYSKEHDVFADIQCLDDFEIFASDGHCLEHACHQKRIDGRYYPDNYIFSLNLRNRMMGFVNLCKPRAGKKRPHEISTLKSSIENMRMGIKRGIGKKIIHAYDPAVVCYEYWQKLKHNGIYIVTREKSNSRPFAEIPLNWDRSNALNNGVLNDEWISSNSTVTQIRRVTYQDPETNRIYKFLTTLTSSKVEPGAIALIYKNRWNIEKAFDVTKNKLKEKKSWSTSNVGKEQQAFAICLAHNLIVLFERYLETTEGIVDEKVIQKRLKRFQRMKENRETFYPLKIVTQTSLQFIRWLRHALQRKRPLWEDLVTLRPLMKRYLT